MGLWILLKLLRYLLNSRYGSLNKIARQKIIDLIVTKPAKVQNCLLNLPAREKTRIIHELIDEGLTRDNTIMKRWLEESDLLIRLCENDTPEISDFAKSQLVDRIMSELNYCQELGRSFSTLPRDIQLEIMNRVMEAGACNWFVVKHARWAEVVNNPSFPLHRRVSALDRANDERDWPILFSLLKDNSTETRELNRAVLEEGKKPVETSYEVTDQTPVYAYTSIEYIPEIVMKESGYALSHYQDLCEIQYQTIYPVRIAARQAMGRIIERAGSPELLDRAKSLFEAVNFREAPYQKREVRDRVERSEFSVCPGDEI